MHDETNIRLNVEGAPPVSFTMETVLPDDATVPPCGIPAIKKKFHHLTSNLNIDFMLYITFSAILTVALYAPYLNLN